jgi:hypothetical protein
MYGTHQSVWPPTMNDCLRTIQLFAEVPFQMTSLVANLVFRMPRPVSNMVDAIRRSSCVLNNGRDHINIATLSITAEKVYLTGNTLFQCQQYASAVIVDMDPVTDLQPISIHWEGATIQSVDNHQRNELFGKLIWTVVVRASGDDGMQTMSMDCSPDQHRL